MKGRKVHALVDTEGLPLRVVVHSAAIQDRDGAALVLDRIRQRFNWLELVWADGGYNARQVEHAVAAQPPLRVEIVKRPDDSAGFIVLSRRWVVERTFSWFGRNRRLAKDYENLADTLAAFITLACIQLAVRRLSQGRRLLSQALSVPPSDERCEWRRIQRERTTQGAEQPGKKSIRTWGVARRRGPYWIEFDTQNPRFPRESWNSLGPRQTLPFDFHHSHVRRFK